MPIATIPQQQYRSLTAGVRPGAELLQGEIFINLADGVQCWRDAAGAVRQFFLFNEQSVPRTISTSSYVVIVSDCWLLFSVACALTLPLPSALNAGRILKIRNTMAVASVTSTIANVVPLLSGIAGTSILPAVVGKWATLVCDGNNWIIMESN